MKNMNWDRAAVAVAVAGAVLATGIRLDVDRIDRELNLRTAEVKTQIVAEVDTKTTVTAPVPDDSHAAPEQPQTEVEAPEETPAEPVSDPEPEETAEQPEEEQIPMQQPEEPEQKEEQEEEQPEEKEETQEEQQVPAEPEPEPEPEPISKPEPEPAANEAVPLSGKLQTQLKAAAKEHGVPYALALAVIERETQFRNIMGDHGASYGYMQVQKRWNRDRMKKLGVSDLMDPNSNFRVGCNILAEHYKRYGSWEKAVVAYNTGHWPGYVTEYGKAVMSNYCRNGVSKKGERKRMEEVRLPELNQLSFDEESHVYRLDGIPIPSVSEVIEPLSQAKYKGISRATLNAAAEKGTAVHNAIENWIKFSIDDCPPEHAKYFEAYLDWEKANQPEVIGSEIRLFHPLFRYGGTADLLAIINQQVVLVDFKTTAAISDLTCPVQLEAYAQALAAHGVKTERKLILQLKKDGRYTVREYPTPDAKSWRVFTSLKTINDYVNSTK